MEREVTPAEIRQMPVGTKVTVHGHDKYGYPYRIPCEIVEARSGKSKELRYTTWEGFERMPIRGHKCRTFTVEVTE